eukprot:Hpha_TRINITY_DN12226_c0_g1::TRINITY_DN12226_c0_g1_i1::g.16697::m.16697/K01771/plc; 1-phosphatidylinositol phosphodiesterase
MGLFKVVGRSCQQAASHCGRELEGAGKHVYKEIAKDPVVSRALQDIANAVDLRTDREAPKLSEFRMWQGELPDEMPLGASVLPGTHDSGTAGMTAFAECQRHSVKVQLKAGIRSLDIRVNTKNMNIHHGDWAAKYTLAEVGRAVADFLSENPSEFVTVRLVDDPQCRGRAAGFDAVPQESFDRMLKKLEECGVKCLAQRRRDFNGATPVRDLRGKMLIMDIPSVYMSEPSGGSHSEIARKVCDEIYAPGGEDRGKLRVLVLAWSSPHPLNNARPRIPAICGALRERSCQCRPSTGCTVQMDFPTMSIIDTLVRLNRF